MQMTDLTTRVPDEQLVYAPLLAAWHRNRDNPELPTAILETPGPYQAAVSGKLGASNLGGCSKKLEYKIRGVPETEPMDEAGYHTTGVGTLVHLAIQAEAKVRPPAPFESVETEFRWELDHCASFADLVGDGGPTFGFEVADVKTINPFGFKMLAKEGPKRDHVLQVGAGMKALGAQTGRLVYIAQSALAGRDVPKGAEKGSRPTRWAEYTFTWADVADLVEHELERLAVLTDRVENGEPIHRFIPQQTPRGAFIVDVGSAPKEKGVWQMWVESEHGPVMLETGESWSCGYCPFQSQCRADIAREDMAVVT